MMEPTLWTSCYNSGWQGVLTPEAFQHPAKASRGLAKRIYQHALERGWLEEGQVVVDPFGGIAGFAFHALQHGLHFVGVELESRFCQLGRQNIALWNARYSRMPKWGSAVLLQGDSRRLSEVVQEAGICISSPPWAGVGVGGTKNVVNLNKQCVSRNRPADIAPGQEARDLRYGSHPAQLGNMRGGDVDAVVSSPPFSNSLHHDGHGIDLSKTSAYGPNSQAVHPTGYGRSEGQLAAMPTGDVDAVVDCAISSPPWAETEVCQDKTFWLNDGRKVPPQGQAGYGTEPGQLAAMPTGEPVDACISSPPWEEGTPTRGDPNYAHKLHGDQSKYGDGTAGNIGNATGNTFWQAARTIAQQVFQVLKPGGYCIWVVKSFVRNKAIVDFPGQWQRMAESCGFETVEIIHALLTEDRGAQYALDGELHEKTVERKSFFRRLHEVRASAKMYWNEHVTDRDVRAGYVRGAHRRLWESYYTELAEDAKGKPPIPTTPPTRTRILTEARTAAYKDAGKPWMDIPTRIDFEVVLCQRKPERMK